MRLRRFVSVLVVVSLLLSSVAVADPGGTVTFDSEISVEADPAEDGDRFRYNLSSADDVDGFEVTLTGRESVEEETAGGTLSDGESVAYGVGGTTPPRNATVEVTGVAEAVDGDLLWGEEDVDGFGEDLTVSDGVAYYVTDTHVHAFDVETRSLLWKTHTNDLGSAAFTAVDAGDGYVFVSDADGRVTGLSASDGSEAFYHRRHTDEVTGIAYSSSEGHLYSGDLSSEIIVWDVDGNSQVETTEATDYVHDLDTDPYGNWYAAITLSGVEGPGWYGDVGGDGDAVAYGEGVVAGAGNGGPEVSVFDAEDGSLVWSHNQHTGEIQDLDVTGGVVYSVGSEKVVAVDLETESVLWSHTLHGPNGGPAAVGVEDGVAYSLGVSDGGDGQLLAYTEELSSTDPQVTIGGESVVDVEGELAPGETVTENVTLAEGESGEVALSTGAGTRADVTLSWAEVTETVDPAVAVNGNTAAVDGVLPEGETAALNVSEAWVSDGENVVEVSSSTAADGPPGVVGLDYGHSAVEERSVNYSAGAWSESYGVSKAYDGPAENATVSIPWASERVADVREVTVEVDGSEVEDVETVSENGTLTVYLGALDGGENVTVEAVGSKVRVENGSIRVLNATPPGESLDTEISVEERGEGFGVDVGGTVDGHLLHYTAAESWSGASSSAVVDVGGGQKLLTDAPAGGSFSVRTAPVEVRPAAGAVEAVVHDPDPDDPRFHVRAHNGSDDPETFEVAYHGAESGETWDLLDVENHRTIETATASSPVWFTAAVEGATYGFRLDESAPSLGDGSAAVAASGGGGGLDLTPTAVLLGTALSVLGILAAGRRFGVSSRRGYLALGGAGLVVGIVGVEAVTHGSVVALTVEAALSPLGGFSAPGAGTVVLGVLLLLGLAAVHTRYPLPVWFLSLASAAIGVWVLDAVTGGALGRGLSEVAPLAWLALIGGVLYLLYVRLKPREIVLGGR